MAFGDRMAMGEGMSLNMQCGHPHVDQTFENILIDADGEAIIEISTVDCPLCGQQVQGALRALPNEETSNEQ